jgi:DNA invertase Pin-like site-specific DNA recombinase
MCVETEKITPRHRERHAYVYVRQSSPKQVQHNRESQRTQYALVERAAALGWPSARVHVIDADLGQSGQDGQRRGFQELVAEVSLGRVGLILAYEASRLARSNADWYALLDLAAVVGALIADAEGVYDPRSYNDRLLLGLRGMLSEAELHLLQMRMAAGRQRQIERGAYRQRLPTGLVRLPDGRAVKDPDLQVQRSIGLVFALFAELGSCQKVLRRLRDDGVRLPRRQTGGPDAGELIWKSPSEGAIYSILHNPAYAGAFAYGRRGAHPDRLPGRPLRQRRRAMTDWTALHRGAYPAYIAWEEYVANQERLADNAARYVLRTRGASRGGDALLTGLVVCGRCGRQMHVEYKERHRYVCSALAKEYGAALCLHLDGPSIDAAVVGAFFEALRPAELDLLDEVLAAARADHERTAQHYADQVTRAEYEARLAQKQYHAVDPENRLVAAELERRWEVALRALAEAREAAERFAATEHTPALALELRTQLADLGAHLPALWESGRLTLVHKKDLLRSLIRRVILIRPRRDAVEATLVWVSGAVTTLTIRPPVPHTADLSDYDRLVARVVALVREGHHDPEIARRLTAEGFRSAHTTAVPTSLVMRLRRQLGETSTTTRFRSQDKVDGQWTVWGLSRALGIDRDWLYARIRTGTVPARRHPVIGHNLLFDPR